MSDYTFLPVFTGDLAGELSYTMANYAIPSAFRRSIESVSIKYRPAIEVKTTGFESVRHVIAPTSGNDILVDISIMLTGDVSYLDRRRLETLAHGMLGAGLSMYFYDDWMDDRVYLCRWVNAGDFVSNTELLAGGSMDLVSWEVQDL